MEDPEQYVKFNWNVKQDVKEVIEEYNPFMEWTRGERILDVGCGPGDVTFDILLPSLPKDAKVVGCDISDNMIKYSRDFYGNNRLSFRKLDIEQKYIDTTWQLGSFDKVYSFYCLHWIHDHRKALQNISSFLKKDGYALLMFASPKIPPFTVLEKLKSLPKWTNFTKEIKWFYDWEDPVLYYNELLQETGFKPIRCSMKKTFHCYPTRDDFFRLLQAVDPYIYEIPDDMKSEYLQDMEDILYQENPFEYDEVNRRYIVEYDNIVSIAKK